jgi:hypothetical protein
VGVLDVDNAVAFDAKRPEAYPLQLLTGHGLDGYLQISVTFIATSVIG